MLRCYSNLNDKWNRSVAQCRKAPSLVVIELCEKGWKFFRLHYGANFCKVQYRKATL